MIRKTSLAMKWSHSNHRVAQRPFLTRARPHTEDVLESAEPMVGQELGGGGSSNSHGSRPALTEKHLVEQDQMAEDKYLEMRHLLCVCVFVCVHTCMLSLSVSQKHTHTHTHTHIQTHKSCMLSLKHTHTHTRTCAQRRREMHCDMHGVAGEGSQ